MVLRESRGLWVKAVLPVLLVPRARVVLRESRGLWAKVVLLVPRVPRARVVLRGTKEPGVQRVP